MKNALFRPSPKPLFSGAATAAVIVLLMAAYVAGYAWSAPNTDTADELMHAYRIREAIAYPLEGPYLGGAVHFGPAWFYLTALPLWISETWLAAALFVGFVCALKFPLAWQCGRRLVDGDFGVLWAVAMFVPGWSTIEELVFLNPNAVDAAALGVLALCLRGIENPMGPWGFAGLGLAMALAIHVHPTVVPVFVMALPLLWRLARHEVVRVALVPLAFGFALPFLPYVASQAMSGFPDWRSASAYVAGQVSFANIGNAPSVVENAIVAGPATIAHSLMGWTSAASHRLGLAMALAAAASVVALGPRRSRRVVAGFAVALVLFAAWIACLRPTTPVQFTWVLTPVVAGLVAAGLWTFARVPALRPVVLLAALASVALDVAAIRALALTVRSGEGTLPSRIMDIKDRIPRTEYRDVWFPAHRHGELGRALCAVPDAASLHGHLAYVFDKDLALDTLFACHARSRLALIGSDAPRHLFGMTRPFWHAIDAAPDCWIGSLGLTARALPLLSRASIPVADGATYLPRRAAGNPARNVTLTARVPAASAVLVTNVLGGYEHFEVVAVQVDGRAVAPAAANDLSALYRAPLESAAAATWTITLAATNPDAVDVVAIDPRARSARSAGCFSSPGPGS